MDRGLALFSMNLRAKAVEDYRTPKRKRSRAVSDFRRFWSAAVPCRVLAHPLAGSRCNAFVKGKEDPCFLRLLLRISFSQLSSRLRHEVSKPVRKHRLNELSKPRRFGLSRAGHVQHND